MPDPIRTARPPEVTSIDNYLIAVFDATPPDGMPAGAEAPVLLRLSSTDDHLYIVACETEEELRDILAGADILSGFKIKQITSTKGFLASIPSDIDGTALHVIKDITRREDGRVRWMECEALELN